VFCNIWKEHRKWCTQLHSITSQHTKILHPLPVWALYHYIWHNHFQVLTYQVLRKKHDQDKQQHKPFLTVCYEWCIIDFISKICIFYTRIKSQSLELWWVRPKPFAWRWKRNWLPKLHTLLTNLLTYSVEQRSSWEANWFAASQEIPHIL